MSFARGHAYIFVALSATCQQSSALSLQAFVINDFNEYIAKYGRTYNSSSPEYQERFGYFQRARAEVERLNSLPDVTWTAALNAFSDRSMEEMSRLNGWRGGGGRRGKGNLLLERPPRRFLRTRLVNIASTMNLPDSVDWTTSLTSLYPRDQGSCGSCWAVAASTVLAAHSELYSSNMSFPTEQVIRCVPNPHHCGGTGGCDGSTVELALQYIMEVGLRSESAYGIDTKCTAMADSKLVNMVTEFSSEPMLHKASFNAAGRKAGLVGWVKLPSNEYWPLMKSVTKGPVAVSMAANNLFSYSSGIFNSCKDVWGKADWIVNHAVTLVGYGKKGKLMYWIVQNSWGASWGENGRFRLIRTAREQKKCGMDEKPRDGLACEGENDPVKVCGSCGILFDSVQPAFAAVTSV